MSEPKHKHYHKDVSDRQTIDIYGVCEVFEVDDVSGRLHHAIKKILMAGKRGSKGYRQDIQEAVDTLNEKLRALDGTIIKSDAIEKTVKETVAYTGCLGCGKFHHPNYPCSVAI